LLAQRMRCAHKNTPPRIARAWQPSIRGGADARESPPTAACTLMRAGCCGKADGSRWGVSA